MPAGAFHSQPPIGFGHAALAQRNAFVLGHVFVKDKRPAELLGLGDVARSFDKHAPLAIAHGADINEKRV
jgi:hypothetical protein